MQKKEWKKPKTWHQPEAITQRNELRQETELRKTSKKATIEATKNDPTKFLTDICKLKPYPYQLEPAELYRKTQFLAS